MVSSRVCVCPCHTLEAGKGFYVTCPGLRPCRALLCEVCPCVHWDMLCVWFAEGQGLSPLRWERSSCTRSVQFSPAIGSIHSGSFFTELQLARPRKQEIWRKSGKRDLRSCLAVFSFLCLSPLAQDTWNVSLHLTT